MHAMFNIAYLGLSELFVFKTVAQLNLTSYQEPKIWSVSPRPDLDR